MGFLEKSAIAFLLSYAISRFLCAMFIKKNESEYGGDGSFNCKKCGYNLTHRQTLTLVKCPSCDHYF